MINESITIIGFGNMGNAIAHALLEQKVIPSEKLVLANPSFIENYAFANTGVTITTSNKEAIKNSKIIILAVKPQSIPLVFTEIKDHLSSHQLIISIAAGVSLQALKKMCGNIKQPIIRSMPNLCLQVKESMTVWVKSSEVTDLQETTAIKIFNAFGEQIQLGNEDLIDVVTAISGSGPAYIFYVAEILENAAIKLGLDKKLATILAKQTIIGSAKLLKVSKEIPASLRQSVTSKGGTTEAALAVFEKDNLQKTFFSGITAAVERAKQLNK